MGLLKKWIRNVFGFSGREINGFVILIPLMLTIVMAQPLYRWWLSGRTENFEAEQRLLDSLIAHWEPVDTLRQEKTQVLFSFDPNIISEKDLQRLGFSEILSKRIANYRQKGGEFRVKADLLRIYGIDSSFYRQLYTYISLPEKKFDHEFRNRESPKKEKSDEQNVHNKLKARFDLNTADTVQLKNIYGIGPALASRIIRFRDGLGGFVSSDQLKEVYGLDSLVVDRLLKSSYIKSDFVPKRIDLNTATEKDLSQHPYIKRALASAIVAYRFQHGNFTSVDELRKITLLNNEDLNRISPYLKINN